MIKGEINLLYIEVEKLLNDICKFLNEEISNGYISQNGRSIADDLITRSKKQLQSISNGSESFNEPYMDMQACKPNQEETDHEVYSDVCVMSEGETNSMTEEDSLICPYANLPATEIKVGKVGNLYKKEKIFFFEQHKKIYAAVQNSWLLIYANENALKPSQTFDLTRYEAKLPASSSKETKKRLESFHLIGLSDTKSYHFTALTSKDMIQWVAAINKPQSDRSLAVKRSLPPVPPVPPNPLDDNCESDNNYEPLKVYQLKHTVGPQASQSQTVEAEPLPLPPRNTATKKISPPPPPPLERLPSEESLNNYDFVGQADLNQSQQNGSSLSSQENGSSFSEDDSDTYYDNPSELKDKEHYNSMDTLLGNEKHKNGYVTQNVTETADGFDEDEIYDYLQAPKSIVKLK